MLSMSSDVNDPGARTVTFDQVYDAYREQVLALHEGGVDLFLMETITDTLNVKAAIKAILDLQDDGLEPLPMWISGTITDRSGRTLSGQTAEAFWNSVRHAKPFAVGFNCALGADLMRPYVAELSRVADTLVAAYPNAGLPNAMGEYDEAPDETGHSLHDWAEQGIVNIVGGCCGTTPEHIRHVADAVAGLKPREIPETPPGSATGRPRTVRDRLMGYVGVVPAIAGLCCLGYVEALRPEEYVMAKTTIAPFVIWAKQVHDAALAERIIKLSAGETIDLVVDGVRGAWRKMDDGKDGRPTPGLRPLGQAKPFWRKLYTERRGTLVEIEVVG